MKLKNTSNHKKDKKGKFMILDIDKENQNSINILLYSEHPDNYTSDKPVALIDVANTLNNLLLNNHEFHRTNLYRNDPKTLLEDRIKICTKDINRTFTNRNFLMNKNLLIDFLQNHTLSNYKKAYPYEGKSTQYIDSYSIDNLFEIITIALRENPDKFYEIFNVRLVNHNRTTNCLEFSLNLEKLYKLLPSTYKYNYPFEYHLVYSFMLIWCANIVFSWLNDLKLIDEDSGMFPCIQMEECENNYIDELESFLADKDNVKQDLVNKVLNTLFEICNNAICNKLTCSSEIILPFSSYNLFNELSRLSNTNRYYTTKHNNNAFEMTIPDPSFIPKSRKYLSCMTPETYVKMNEDGESNKDNEKIKSNRKANPSIKLTVRADRKYTNVIHCSIEVHNRIGFYYLISSKNNDNYKNNIYACSLLFSFYDFPSNLAILLISAFCIYNKKAHYIKHNLLGHKIIYKDSSNVDDDSSEIERIEPIRYSYYNFNPELSPFYDVSVFEDIISKLRKIFKTAPHNIFSVIINAFIYNNTKDFNKFIKEFFKDLRNSNNLLENFSKAYKIVKNKLLNAKQYKAVIYIIKYAQEVISC